MNVLISVYDKTGIVEFAQEISALGYKIVASGGTSQVLKNANLQVSMVEDLTGLPAILDGRVKTLHPAIHAGVLARNTEEDKATLAAFGWGFFDMVIVNLYPFIETIKQEMVTLDQAIEQIDIGGVALIRAAAKNFQRAIVLTEPGDYQTIVSELRAHGTTTLELRQHLAAKAFRLTAIYDQVIASYIASQDTEPFSLPSSLTLSLPRAQVLRYGENPHQKAALYSSKGDAPLGSHQLQGKPLSYNNLLDIDAAWTAASDFEDPTVVIVKHLSPTGIATNQKLASAFRAALASDPISAFGGVIACNRTFTGALAETLGDLFVEAIAAPEFTNEALQILHSRQNCRLLRMDKDSNLPFALRSVRNGFLLQTHDDLRDFTDWQIVTERSPSSDELRAMQFGWQAVKHVKSNAIVLASEQATVGIGGGLPSRVDAVKLAVTKAGIRANGAVLASDAFFPFPDGPEIAAAAGITAIVQPGGSQRDNIIIETANTLGLAMCFTGHRHFRH